MGDIHFYQRPWFYLIFPPILIIILYFFTAPQGLDYEGHLRGIIKDIVIYIGLLILWLAFFSQFILPVQTFRDRQKIFDRLIAYLIGIHGPAIFIRDGQPVQRDREESKQGRGVLWLDSASGVVTRTDAAFKNTLGPGVHFTEKGEKIADIVDLHIQIHNIGPMARDDPFAQKTDQQTEEEYDSIQKRRALTSGLTRDGIEVIPNINVVFKIDADPITDPNLAGSRFGFNANAVRRAITGQAINPNMPRDSYRYHVRWNELPALLAADVWRDLLSKFKLNDLFEPKYSLPPSFPNPPQPTITDDALHNPIKPQSKFEYLLTGIFKDLNRTIAELANRIDNYCRPKEKVQPETAKEKKAEVQKEKKVTGLQVISFLMKERLQKQKTAVLDQFGNYQPGQDGPSNEYGFLQRRGIRVLSVGASNLRLPSEVDLKLIRQWTANWLDRARAERDRLDQEEGFNRIQNEEIALRDYIARLSKDLLLQVNRNRAIDLRGTLRTLMLETRSVLVNENQLYRQSSPEREALEEVIQWLETRDI
jgi:hypothetical protein